MTNSKTHSLWATTICLGLLLVVISAESQQWSTLAPQVDDVLKKATQNIWDQIESKEEPIWNMPPWLGTLFIAEYYFELKVLNITGDLQLKTKFDVEFFKQKLLSEQRQDGSWDQIVDLNKKYGSLDATVFNYWFLKDVGIDLQHSALKNARKFILNHGGIEQTQIMTRYKLAIFGQYQWHLLPYVPLFIFKNYLPFSWFYMKDYVGQWVYPHLLGLAYLRYHKTIFAVSEVCLSELRTSRSTVCEDVMMEMKPKHDGSVDDDNGKFYYGYHVKNDDREERDSDVDNLLQEAIKIKGPKGLIGAYTISTLLVMMSFKDYTLRYKYIENDETILSSSSADPNPLHSFYTSTIEQSLSFVEYLYFNRRVPYWGSLDDGRYWDTILSLIALVEVGEDLQKIHPTMKFMIETAVQENGGIPYGLEFEYAPDIDDTAMLMYLYGVMKRQWRSGSSAEVEFNVQKSFENNGTGEGNVAISSTSYEKQINRTFSWLKANQNSDGGFPAFDKDKNDDQYKLIKWIFKLTKIDKSAEIFDPSCPDIVGHMLQGMGSAQLYQQYQVIDKSVQYLYNSRKDGMWSARWGINYIYAVGSVLPGLARVGYDLNQTWILDVIKRMRSLQQEDGGFGEDSEGYNEDRYVEGVTTVSMTAWGLLAYLEVVEYDKDLEGDILRCVEYLLKNFHEDGRQRFYDRSVVGTGHRGVLNLQYPVYAYSFPTVALSRAREYFKGNRKVYLNEGVNKNVRRYDENGAVIVVVDQVAGGKVDGLIPKEEEEAVIKAESNGNVNVNVNVNATVNEGTTQDL